MIADDLCQSVAAVIGKDFDEFLDFGDLPPCEASAEKGGGFECLDFGVQLALLRCTLQSNCRMPVAGEYVNPLGQDS